MTAREYAKTGPSLWTGDTGKQLRRRGFEGLLVAAYLISSPMSNMLGLYHQPKLYMAHETGLGVEGAEKGLRDCIDVGFCAYDEATEFVFVFNMAKWQVSEVLKPGDKRCKGIQNLYDKLPDNPYLAEWFDKYAEAFHLTTRRSPIEGAYQHPSKPGAGAGAGAGAVLFAARTLAEGSDDPPAATPATPPPKVAPRAKPTRAPKPPAASSPVFDAYAEAYRKRYGAQPVRNAKVNSQLAQLVQKRLPAEEAPQVAAFYVGHEGARYVAAMHSVDLLLLDAEKLRTEWATGRQHTSTGPPGRRTSANERATATVAGLTGRSQPTAAPPYDPRPEPPGEIIDLPARAVG